MEKHGCGRPTRLGHSKLVTKKDVSCFEHYAKIISHGHAPTEKSVQSFDQIVLERLPDCGSVI